MYLRLVGHLRNNQLVPRGRNVNGKPWCLYVTSHVTLNDAHWGPALSYRTDHVPRIVRNNIRPWYELLGLCVDLTRNSEIGLLREIGGYYGVSSMRYKESSSGNWQARARRR